MDTKLQRVKPSVAANMLGITLRTLQRWIKAGRVPTILTDTNRRFISVEWIRKQMPDYK